MQHISIFLAAMGTMMSFAKTIYSINLSLFYIYFMLPNKQRLRLKKIKVNTCHLMLLIADTGIHHKSDHNSDFIAQLVTHVLHT